MRKVLTLIFVVITLWQSALAQEAGTPDKTAESKSQAAYKVEFALREMQDGKVINSRNYTMVVQDRQRGQTKVGARVPVRGYKEEIQYLEIGVNINCSVKAESSLVGVDATVDVSSFALPEQRVTQGLNEIPVLSQMRLAVSAAVPEDKQTVIGLVDDASSTKRYEIAVTASKLK